MKINSLKRIILFGVFMWITVFCSRKTSNISYDKNMYLEADEVLEVRVNERVGDFSFWTFDLKLKDEAFQRLDGYTLNAANIGERLFLTNKRQTVSLIWLSPYSDIGNYSASIMINTQRENVTTVVCLNENARVNVQEVLLN